MCQINREAIGVEQFKGKLSFNCITCRGSIGIKLINSNINLSLNIIKSFATELGFSNNRTVTLTQKHIRGRLAESLLVLRDTYGVENDGKTIRAYVSREDLACFSNMTTSNAIRTLSVFATESVLALDGKKICILDPARLEKISQMG